MWVRQTEFPATRAAGCEPENRGSLCYKTMYPSHGLKTGLLFVCKINLTGFSQISIDLFLFKCIYDLHIKNTDFLLHNDNKCIWIILKHVTVTSSEYTVFQYFRFALLIMLHRHIVSLCRFTYTKLGDLHHHLFFFIKTNQQGRTCIFISTIFCRFSGNFGSG